MNALIDWNARQLDLIRRTVAKDTDAAEFDMFIHMCKAVRLDPLRKQVFCFVFNKNSQWRQMTVVTAIGGYRAIADRTGNYRPDDKAPRYDMCEANEATNPLGIQRAEVTVYKHAHGEWFPVVGEAWWDEYVPLKDGAIDTKKTGWIKMPRIMIAKCAEANALRKAWPDDFAGLEVEEEVDRRHSLDLSASELAEIGSQEKRLEAIGGGNKILIDWMDGDALQPVPVGELGDKAIAFVRHNASEPSVVLSWRERNRHGFQEYWARDKDGALALKQEIEQVEKSALSDAAE